MNVMWLHTTKQMIAGAGLLGLAAAAGIAYAQPGPGMAPEKAGEKGAPAALPEPVKLPVNLTLAPATTFAEKCVRCHGVEGAKYKASLWTANEAKRHATVTSMMKGRAKLTPEPADIEAMSSFVQSTKGGAFVAIVNGADFASGKSEKLIGDATAGAKVTLVKDGKETPLALTKSAWTLDAAPKAPFTVKAVNGDFTAEINFPQKQWAFAANPVNKTAAPAKGGEKGEEKGEAKGEEKGEAPAKAN